MQIKYKLITFQNIAVVHGNYIWLSLIYQTEVQNLARIKNMYYFIAICYFSISSSHKNPYFFPFRSFL